ncbi:mediator complex, subunit Med18 [Elsinoe ampelina]|uniref:Mediator of RNA polymerase II transcription subunit 18 n=1 Tax=Elsinoe ampelina TaxID=302913 RepID=A0A6A6G2Z9_9PEZI|nr:mediator complex, subunit Med18 [Elsinoe ampelina]
MHSLTLYAPLPSARHAQALHILTGLSAAQPTETFSRVAIFAPVRAAVDTNLIAKKKNNAAQQPGQLTLVQLVEGLSREGFGGRDESLSDGAGGQANGAEAGTETGERDGEKGQKRDGDDDVAMEGSAGVAPRRLAGKEEGRWMARTQEIPEPETKNVVLRRVTEERITGEDVKGYMEGGKYRFVNEYFTEGHRFVYRDVVLHLHRVLVTKTSSPGEGMSMTQPALEDLGLLDASGAFVLEATVRVEDRSKPALVQGAMEQLLALRNELKGAIELRVPERLSMDTRVRN